MPNGTVQRLILLGRDSWKRFEQHKYITLPHLSLSADLRRTFPHSPLHRRHFQLHPRHPTDNRHLTPRVRRRSRNFLFSLPRSSPRTAWCLLRVIQHSPATTWSICFPATAFPPKPKYSSPTVPKLSCFRDSLILNQTTFWELLPLPSYKPRHQLSKTSPRNYLRRQPIPTSTLCTTIPPWPTTHSLLPTPPRLVAPNSWNACATTNGQASSASGIGSRPAYHRSPKP